MSDNMESAGILSILKLSSEERQLFIDYLCKVKPELNADLLDVLFQDKVLMVLDAFAGAKVKFPTREVVEKIVSYIKIYAYCKVRGFTNESYDLTAKVFNRRKTSISRIIDKVDKILNSEGSN